jgi:hypothetical protein
MPTETQKHLLHDGKKVIISRDGHHQYWIGDKDTKDKEKMPSVTGLLGPLDGGFGVGMGWALKVAREAGGDLEAPRRVSKEARDQGNLLHDAIDNFISEGIVDEESPLFVAWLNEVGNHHDWYASEKYLYHPKLRFGGTVDACERYAVIWDWKTKDRESYDKYGSSDKDQVQLSAYAAALNEMGSVYAPSSGKIAYIMRDGSGVEVVEVNLNKGWEMFKVCHHLHSLRKAWVSRGR